MKPIARRQIRIASSYALLAFVCLLFLGLTSSFPPLLLWSVFAIAFILLEFNAVEVNDRMLQSSGSMVLLTAGTLFAIEAETSAAFAIASMAALGPLVPEDLRLRRWFQPIANFGQLVVSATACGLLLDLFLSDLGDLSTVSLVRVAAVGAVVSAVYTAINVGMVRYAVRYVYGQRTIQPWSGLHVLMPSQVVMGMLGGVLGASFHLVGRPAVIVLILGVYLIAHLSFASYSQLREAHQAAMRGFVKVLEARDLYTRGHTERVAYFAQLIGEQLRLTGTQLERLRWSALIHDLSTLAMPGGVSGRSGQLSGGELEEAQHIARDVARALSEVDFLAPMAEISGSHYLASDASQPASLEESVIAVADRFDELTSTRRHRMAMSQSEAFATLRGEGGRFLPEMVEALEKALARTGEVYGGPPLESRRDLVLEESPRA